MRLAMSILVRDEADIIEANIRYHASRGVSRFIVTDNGSVDGSREILEKLTDEFHLSVIDEPSHTIDQDLWVTRMAKELAGDNSADWVINNDADEFWIASEDQLLTDVVAQHLDQTEKSVGVLYCPRSNFVPFAELTCKPGYDFSQNCYQVLKDWSSVSEMLHLDHNSAAILPDGQHVIIRTLTGKVITRLEGLASIDMGNHSAKHQFETIEVNDIQIAHYPIRSYSQFKRKVINYGSSIENNERFGPQISLHLRRWYASYKSGALQQEYDAIVLPENILCQLVEQGILQHAVADVGPTERYLSKVS